MSETFESPTPEGMGGPLSRPNGGGLPPKTGGDLHRPGSEDSVDAAIPGEGGDIGQDVGGMPGEG